MFRVRNDRRRWRLRWPWRWIFPLKVVERYCRECGLPYNDGPLPEVVAKYSSNNVCLQVFPAGSARRKDLDLRVGRWQRSLGKHFLSDFVPVSEIDDLLTVVLRAHTDYSLGETDRFAKA